MTSTKLKKEFPIAKKLSYKQIRPWREVRARLLMNATIVCRRLHVQGEG